MSAELLAYLTEALGLLARWAHLVVGIAWIGASFYFIFLDNSLEPPKEPDDAKRGVAGELWAVHGGGFYHARKYAAAPPAMPETLHWFKWEAYWTWITGFSLLVLVHYVGAGVYLVDPAVMPLSNGAAIAIGLGSLAAGWIVYDGLCRSPLGRNDRLLAAVLFVLLAVAAWGLTRVFSGRGAFIHYGAILGTIMVANVAMVIIPGQRRWVRALAAGQPVDPGIGIRAKQRSVHNTYFTLPVLFTMISSHYAFTYAQRWGWLLLVAMTLSGALIRVWFVQRHKGKASPWPLAAGLAILGSTLGLLAPRPTPAPAAALAPVTFHEVSRIVAARCASCHAEQPTQPGFAAPPKNLMLDSEARIRAAALTIYQQAVAARVMPPGNLTGLTDEERALLGRWALSEGASRPAGAP